jgi:hypothetical protein
MVERDGSRGVPAGCVFVDCLLGWLGWRIEGLTLLRPRITIAGFDANAMRRLAQLERVAAAPA